MSEQNVTTENQQSTVDTEATGGNAEAAKYRRQLRDAEATRDDLQRQIDARNREAIERRAGIHLAVPADLFDLGDVVPADLLADDGRPDADKVEAAARALIEVRPGLAAAGEVETLIEAWRDNGNTGPDADRYAQKLRELAPFLDVDSFRDENGDISGERLEAFNTATKAAFNWPDLGGGRRGTLDGVGGAGGWAGLVRGR